MVKGSSELSVCGIECVSPATLVTDESKAGVVLEHGDGLSRPRSRQQAGGDPDRAPRPHVRGLGRAHRADHCRFCAHCGSETTLVPLLAVLALHKSVAKMRNLVSTQTGPAMPGVATENMKHGSFRTSEHQSARAKEPGK